MIRTNLATRPFYNTRAVSLWLALLGTAVAAATLFNVVTVIIDSRSDSALARQARADSERAAALRAEAAKLRASVDTREVDLIASEAHTANDLIDRRVFSWTELFNRFEQTLPVNVRITAVRPKVDRDRRVLLSVNVVARSVDDVNQFMESLEKTGAFAGLLSREERVNEEGQLEATLESVYVPATGDQSAASVQAAPAVQAVSPSPAAESPTTAPPESRQALPTSPPSTGTQGDPR